MHFYSLVSEFAVVLALPEIINICKEIILIEKYCQLSYDTTFQLGGFYLSLLIFRCSYFDENPSIPVAALLHDTKLEKVQSNFFKTLTNVMPELNSDHVVLVTDRESGIVKAINTAFSKVHHVFCWNHLLKDVEHWVRKHDGKHSDVTVYVNNILLLLQCPTEAKFDELCSKLKKKWSIPFLEYFEKNVRKDIVDKGARWILERYGIYTQSSGVTTNVSESMNAVFKRIVKWQEVNVDAIVHTFYFLQTFYQMEILRGRCGLGNYHLKMENCHLELDPHTTEFPQDYVQLNDIGTIIRNKNVSITSATAIKIQQDSTALGLAKLIIEEHRIYLNAQCQSFIVKGLRGKECIVKLFPQERCTCNSTRTCYHILAARLSIGVTDSKTNKSKLSLKSLKTSSRKTKSGRKRPRQGDILETTAAPDSLEETGNYEKKFLSPQKSEIISVGDPVMCSTPKTTPLYLPWAETSHYPTFSNVLVGNIAISIKDLNSLKRNHWLNDAIIDGFLLSRTLLQHAQQNYVDVCVVSSHVMKTIEQTNNVCVEIFEEHLTMSSSDIWIMPINVNGNHWILTIVFVKWKMILYLDSMSGFSETIVSRVQGFIAYHIRKSSTEDIVWSEWTLHAPNDIIPQQDSTSCGVHVCLYTHVLCSGRSFTFPHNMETARMWIAKELQTVTCSNKRAFLPILQKSKVKNYVPKPLPISRNPPAGQKSTMEFLASAISEYFKSTWSFCFMSEKCLRPKESEMILCEGHCREWYHLTCIKHQGQIGKKSYICPNCHKNEK